MSALKDVVEVLHIVTGFLAVACVLGWLMLAYLGGAFSDHDGDCE